MNSVFALVTYEFRFTNGATILNLDNFIILYGDLNVVAEAPANRAGDRIYYWHLFTSQIEP